MKSSVRVQLSAMMFLEYFIWGVWYVTMGIYLTKIGFHGKEIGAAYSTLAIGAIISSFFVSMIADRYCPYQCHFFSSDNGSRKGVPQDTCAGYDWLDRGRPRHKRPEY